MSFSARLQQAMDDKHIRPAELSRMTGIGEGAISQYRKGAYKAGQRNLKKLAAALCVPVEWLVDSDSPCNSSVDLSAPSPAEFKARVSNPSQRLQQILSERNLKQADVLRLAEPYCREYRQKLGRSDLSQFVSGKVIPGQWKLTLIALALNISEAWLMGYDVPQERGHPLSPLPFSVGLSNEQSENQFINRLRQLSPEELQKVDAFVQGLLANR